MKGGRASADALSGDCSSIWLLLPQPGSDKPALLLLLSNSTKMTSNTETAILPIVRFRISTLLLYHVSMLSGWVVVWQMIITEIQIAMTEII